MLVFDGLIDIVADKQLVSRVRHGIIGGLPPDGLWLTHSEGAREIERMIRSGEKLADIPRLMTEVDASLEEWRLLSWEYMQVLAVRESANASVSRAFVASPRHTPDAQPEIQGPVSPPTYIAKEK
jgi:hypothetical protein